MDLQEKLFLAALLILAAAIQETQADTMVTGTVFCDQCKDGQRSLLDYPVNGKSDLSPSAFCYVLKDVLHLTFSYRIQIVLTVKFDKKTLFCQTLLRDYFF